MRLTRIVREMGWRTFALFVAAALVAVLGVIGQPPWLTVAQIGFGLFCLLLGIMFELYGAVSVDIKDKISGGTQSLDLLLIQRRERIQRGGIIRFEELKRRGARVRVAGISCVNFINENEADIREALIAGAVFEFVLVDPAMTFLGLYDVNMPNQSTEISMRDDVNKTLAKLTRLQPFGSLEVRCYPGLPMYSALWIYGEPRREMCVEFYTFGGSPSNRPTFMVHEGTKWYGFFERSLNMLWEASTKKLGPETQAA